MNEDVKDFFEELAERVCDADSLDELFDVQSFICDKQLEAKADEKHFLRNYEGTLELFYKETVELYKGLEEALKEETLHKRQVRSLYNATRL